MSGSLGVVAVCFDEVLLSLLHPGHVLSVLGVKDQLTAPGRRLAGLKFVGFSFTQQLAPADWRCRGDEKVAHVVVG